MTKRTIPMLAALLLPGLITFTTAQDTQTVSVPLSDPGKPVTVRLSTDEPMTVKAVEAGLSAGCLRDLYCFD